MIHYKLRFFVFKWATVLLLCTGLTERAVLYGQSQKADSLQQLFQNTKNDSLKAIYGIALSREMQKKKLPETEVYKMAQTAIEYALNKNNTLLYARSLDNLGLLYRNYKNYPESFDLHKQAYHLIESLPVPSQYKMIYANNAGVAARRNQEYTESILYYMKALELAEEENDLKNIAISSNGIGNALGQIPERQEEAIVYFKRSLAAEEERNNSLGMAMNYLSIGDYYISTKEFDTARSYFTKVMNINKSRNDFYGQAIANQFFGISYLDEEIQLDKAYHYFKKSLDGFRELNDIHKEASLLFFIAKTRQKQQQIQEAEKTYYQALSIAKKIKNLSLLHNITMNLSEIQESKNNYHSAFSFYKQSMAYGDSIRLKEQSVRIEALTRKYDLTQKEKTIALLEKDKELKETLLAHKDATIRSHTIGFVLLISSLLFVTVILLLSYWNYHIKKKTEILISQEEKKRLKAIYERDLAQKEAAVNQLRINPHFLFNSLNAINYLVQSNQNLEAIKYLKVFSRYTRMVLETSKNNTILFREEVKLAKHYLTLEKNRFDKKFNTIIIGEDNPLLDYIHCPPLLLQPFLENAIWHGLMPSHKEELILQITINENGNNLEVLIDDNGIGRKEALKRQARKTHQSMGVNIIKERMDLFNKSFKDKISYTIIDKTEGEKALGTRIKINIEINRPDVLNIEKTG